VVQIKDGRRKWLFHLLMKQHVSSADETTCFNMFHRQMKEHVSLAGEEM